jgi:Tfp pilus assembly protein PilP
MWSRALLLALLLAACSQGAQADLQYIGQARSAAAEWALVNQQASQHQLNRTYVASMHRWLRDEIQSSATSLTQPNSRYGQEMRALLKQPDDAPPAALRAHAEQLKQIEDSLESA